MPEIVLPAGAEHVTVEEIPALLALALFPLKSPGRVLSYITKYDPLSLQGLPLAPGDETLLSQVWHALPPWQSGITDAEWSTYAEAFNAAEARPDWVPMPVWRNDAQNASVLRADAEEQHRRTLADAIAMGELVALSHARLPSRGFPGDIVLVDALAAYAARYEVTVRVAEPTAQAQPVTAVASLGGAPVDQRPHFVTEVRPQSVPAALLRLNPDTFVSFEVTMGREQKSCGAFRARDYIADIETRIERQAQGFFTVNEAAQVLADERQGLNGLGWALRLLQAYADGELAIRDAGTRLRLVKGERANDYCHLVKVPDLNAWFLKSDTGYGFPTASPSELQSKSTGVISESPPPKSGALPNEKGLSTKDIANCFDGLHWSEVKWKKPLGDKPKWLRACIVQQGARGVCETRWNPVLIGAALVAGQKAQARSVRAKFQTKHQLKPWLDAWKTYESENIYIP